MSSLPAFTLQRPTRIDEAVALLCAPGARALAGGTDLVPNLRHGLGEPSALVDLGGIAELAALAFDESGLVVGAGVTIARVARDAAIARAYPALHESAAAVAGPAHRASATVGGNLCLDTRCVFYNQSEPWRSANGWCLKYRGDTCHVAPQGSRCHAAFSGDLAPALLALSAEVEIAGRSGEGTMHCRWLPLADLYRDDGANHLTLAPGEIVVAVRVPPPADGSRNGYRKARIRGSIDFPLAGVAASLALARNGAVASLRIGITGTNSRPIVLDGCEAMTGRAVDDALLAEIGKRIQKQVSPMRTTLTASNYRRQVATVLARRLVAELARRC